MPKNMQGHVFYTTNSTGDVIAAGAPVTEEGVVGVAVKQKTPSWDSAVATHVEIADDEDFAILTHGVVEVDTVAGFAVGDPVYIDASDNSLTETATDNIPFGRVVEVAGERGTPTGKVRINLDFKDNIDAVTS